MDIQVTILGTGTSQGVPVIGCDCKVCRSTDPHDQRLRTSALVSVNGININIDCGPDFRQQMLRSHTQDMHAIIFTHQHNDHIIGMDDVRPFNFKYAGHLDVYATEPVAWELKHRFAYIFDANPYPGAPRVAIHRITGDTPFQVQGIPIIPIEVWHGQMPVLGFRIGNFAYITDIKSISAPELEKLRGLDTLVLSALHHTEHHSHLNLQQAMMLAEKIGPRQTYFTHMSHRMGLHAEVNSRLPKAMQLGFDGLTFKVSG